MEQASSQAWAKQCPEQEDFCLPMLSKGNGLSLRDRSSTALLHMDSSGMPERSTRQLLSFLQPPAQLSNSCCCFCITQFSRLPSPLSACSGCSLGFTFHTQRGFLVLGQTEVLSGRLPQLWANNFPFRIMASFQLMSCHDGLCVCYAVL